MALEKVYEIEWELPRLRLHSSEIEVLDVECLEEPEGALLFRPSDGSSGDGAGDDDHVAPVLDGWSPMKGPKPVDSTTIRKQTDKAITLRVRRDRRSTGNGPRRSRRRCLNENILRIEQTFMVVLPAAPPRADRGRACRSRWGAEGAKANWPGQTDIEPQQMRIAGFWRTAVVGNWSRSRLSAPLKITNSVAVGCGFGHIAKIERKEIALNRVSRR